MFRLLRKLIFAERPLPKQGSRAAWLFFWCFLLSTHIFAQSVPTTGRDFWFTGINGGLTGAGTYTYMDAFVFSDSATTGTLTVPGLSYVQNFTVTPGVATHLTIPGNSSLHQAQTVIDKGMHITTQDNVTVYGRLDPNAIVASDGTPILPTHALDSQYIMHTYYDLAINNNPLVTPKALVVATCDSTVIEIIPNANTSTGSPGGVPIVVTLDQGECYYLKPATTNSMPDHDHTGTTIRSLNVPAKTFGVFMVNSVIYAGCFIGDRIYEQMVGTSHWGTEFLPVPLPGTNGEFFRVVASEPNTVVQYNGVVGTTLLQIGDFFDTTLTAPTYITSNKPIDLSLGEKGYHCSNNRGDPEFMRIYPLPHLLTSVRWQSQFTNTPVLYHLCLISPTTQTPNVLLNGVSQMGNFSVVPSNPAYSFAQLTITPGQYHLEAPGGVQGYAAELATNSQGSFGTWLTGNELNPSISLGNIDLGPDTSVCSGTAVPLDAGPGLFSILWSTGDTTQSIAPDSAGTYWVSAGYQINSCLSISVFDTIVISNSGVSFDLGPDTNLCGQDSLVLQTLVSNANHTWSTGDTSSSISITSGGTYWVTATDTSTCSFSDTITVQFFQVDSIDLGNDTLICSGDSLQLLTSGNGTTYLWSTGDTLASIWGDSSTTYWVEVTDSNQCTFSDSLMLTVAALPIFDLGPDTFLCTSNPILLTPTGYSGAVMWSTGQTAGTQSVNTSGSYWALATDSNQCEFADTISIFYVSTNLPNLGIDTTICTGDTLTLNAPPGATAYTWSTGSNNASISAFAAGTYWVTANYGNQCQTSDTIVIQVAPLPLVDLGPDTSFCQGGSLALNGPPNHPNYLWSTGHSTPALGITSGGSYWLQITDSNQCVNSDTINVTPLPLPVFSLGNDTGMCDGDTISLFVPINGVLYQWSTGSFNSSIQVDQGGNYWATATDINQCSYTDSVLVTTLARPQVNLGNDTILCDGDTLFVDVSAPGVQFLWSDGATLPQRFIHQPGNFSVVASTGFGCQAIDSLEVKQGNLELGPPIVKCENEFQFLEVPDTLNNIHWQGFSPGAEIVVKQSGVYHVNAYYGSCLLTDSIQVTFQPLPIHPHLQDTAICFIDFPQGWTLEAGDNQYTYDWSTGDNAPSITVDLPGVYSVDITTQDQCTLSDTVEISNLCTSSIFFPNSFTPNSDGINDVFQAYGRFVPEYELQIFDRWGELIFSTTDFAEGWDGTYNGKEAPVGVYVWSARYRLINLRGGNPEFEKIGRVTLVR